MPNKCASCKEIGHFSNNCPSNPSAKCVCGRKIQAKGLCGACYKRKLYRDDSNVREQLKFKTIKNFFGLTADQYNELVAKQNGKCAICKQPCKLQIDHNHVTLVTRGLLCSNCNSGLGKFADSTERLAAAIQYLQHPPSPPVIGKFQLNGVYQRMVTGSRKRRTGHNWRGGTNNAL